MTNWNDDGGTMNRTDFDMVATEYRNGVPTKYEIVHQPQAQMPRVIGADDAPPIVAPVMPERVPRVQHIITGSPIDEAHAFNVKISSLAAVLGGGAVLMAVMFGASLSLWTGIMWFGSVYALTWAAAFVLDALRSPGGIELFHAANLWSFLRREQEFRHSRYDVPQRSAPGWLGPVLLALAVGFTVLFLAIIIIGVAVEQMPR